MSVYEPIAVLLVGALLSVTVMVKGMFAPEAVELPVIVQIWLSTPEVLKLNPAGNPVADHVYGGVAGTPPAVSVVAAV